MVMYDLWERWLRTKALVLSPTTLALYAGHIRTHLNPAFGDRPVSDLNEDDVLSYVATKRAVLHRNTVARQLSMLHQVCAYAVNRQMISQSPCEHVHLSTRLQPTATVLDEEQVRTFLREAWRSRYYPLYLLALCTGLRRGEIMGLRWQDVDWTTGSVLICETFVHIPSSNTWITKEPKTQRGRRRVEVPRIVLDILRPMYDRRTSRQGKVFTNPDGRPWSVRYIVSRDLPKVCARAGVPKLRLHDLRHTYATLRLNSLHHNPRAVQESLGHSRVEFTLAIYAHVLPGDGSRAAQELQAKLFGPTVIPTPSLPDPPPL